MYKRLEQAYKIDESVMCWGVTIDKQTGNLFHIYATLLAEGLMLPKKPVKYSLTDARLRFSPAD